MAEALLLALPALRALLRAQSQGRTLERLVLNADSCAALDAALGRLEALERRGRSVPTVVVGKEGGDYFARVVEGTAWGSGRTPKEALGDLLQGHGSELGVAVRVEGKRE